jgi:hypothetical protein
MIGHNESGPLQRQLDQLGVDCAWLKAKCDRQSEMLALALKEKNDWMFKFQERQTVINKLEAELKKLRPPESKFYVGQVVAVLDGHAHVAPPYMKIEAKLYTPAGRGNWSYQDHRTCWFAERELRALTEDEVTG